MMRCHPGDLRFSRVTLVPDAMADPTVALVTIPEGMAFAMIAGVNPAYGQYTGDAQPLLLAGIQLERRLPQFPPTLFPKGCALAVFAAGQHLGGHVGVIIRDCRVVGRESLNNWKGWLTTKWYQK